jgi:hypothetical protein
MEYEESAMRCPKCAYVSFDHLEECIKCSRDLVPFREELNLMDFKPEVPFLLGSLVGEMQGGGVQRDLTLTQETELELGGLDMGLGTEGTIDMQDLEIPDETDSSKEVSLSEVALDDLETIESSALGDSGDFELNLDDMAEMGGEDKGLAEMGSEDADLAEMSTEDVGLVEEDEDFLGLEIETDESSEEDFGALEEVLTAEPTAEPESEELDPGAALEVDLNEDDLSELAKTLEVHFDSEAGEKKKVPGDDLALGQEEVVFEMEDE